MNRLRDNWAIISSLAVALCMVLGFAVSLGSLKTEFKIIQESSAQDISDLKVEVSLYRGLGPEMAKTNAMIGDIKDRLQRIEKMIDKIPRRIKDIQ